MAGFVREPDGALARSPGAEGLFLTRDEDGAFILNEGTPASGSASEKMWIDPDNGLFLFWNKGRWEPIRVKSLPVDHLTAGLADVDQAAIKTLVSSKGFIDQLFAGQATIGSENGTVVIKDGAVTAESITASEELWAKIATFAKITTEQLVAGGAKITGEVLADVIRLATKIVCGDDDNGVTIDMSGVHVYKDGTEMVRLSTQGNGLRIFNESMGRMVDLSSSAFGSWSYSGTGNWIMEYPSSASAVLETQWGPWKVVPLSTFTPATNRVKCWSTFNAGNNTIAQQWGGQGRFNLRPNGPNSTTGQVIATDSGSGYYDSILQGGARSGMNIVNVTAGQKYDVVFVGRMWRNQFTNITKPTLGQLKIIIDPA